MGSHAERFGGTASNAWGLRSFHATPHAQIRDPEHRLFGGRCGLLPSDLNEVTGARPRHGAMGRYEYRGVRLGDRALLVLPATVLQNGCFGVRYQDVNYTVSGQEAIADLRATHRAGRGDAAIQGLPSARGRTGVQDRETLAPRPPPSRITAAPT